MIFISAGHGYKDLSKRIKDSGVVYKNFVEHKRAFSVAYFCYLYLYSKTEVIFIPTASLIEKVDFINKFCGSKDLAIEFHFNSLPEVKDISFSEILVYSVENKKDIIEKIKKGILEYRDKGEEQKKYPSDVRVTERKDLYFLRKTKCTSVILEVEFIWNADKINYKLFGQCIAKNLL